jgi:hypothetical protein
MAIMVGHQVFLAPWFVCPRLVVVLAVRLIMPSLVAQVVVLDVSVLVLFLGRMAR